MEQACGGQVSFPTTPAILAVGDYKGYVQLPIEGSQLILRIDVMAEA